MKRLKILFAISAISAFVFSCKKDLTGPSAEDNFLNYKIEEIPVTADYTVGCFYYTFGGFNTQVKDNPVLGKYNYSNGNPPAGIMAKQIAFAAQAGIDYFVFSIRSANKDNGNYRSDSATVRNFLDNNAEGKMKFALQYNLNTGQFGLSATNPIEKSAANLDAFCNDFVRMAPYLKDANIMKVDGKPMLFIQNAMNLNSDSSKKVYDTLRSRLKAQGVDAYIVGMQDRWTPPARYDIRFRGGTVNALYHSSYSTQISNWDRFYLLPQMMDQAWIYSAQYFKDNFQAAYIPNVSPGYDPTISNASTTNPTYARADSGALYQTLCNVAKKNVNPQLRMVLIDSWNNWGEGSQLEPSSFYGDLFLKLTRKQFKKQ
ncbi:hypothetical protein DVR12_14370 [Chitinophaga silvatica]|uniref:Glycosyltransferase WbsX n=1 Tax=Chitinophaga silvatica TaxID=2282649 RepID=A0A3E1Y8U0_9BACT|nr:glycoside hydrolase family 99-like domain-containing protein [Chitinophaga silvatica]RFS21838.1 hypothetical protein DVR12_14370 [Chitinophaga silvatica]